MPDAAIGILRIVGAVAGIGGLAFGVFLLLFREVIRKQIAVQLTKEQFFKLMIVVIVLVFLMSLGGVLTWATMTIALDTSQQKNAISELERKYSDLQKQHDELSKNHNSVEDKALKSRIPAIDVREKKSTFDLRKQVAVPLDDRQKKKLSVVTNTQVFRLARAFPEQTSFIVTAGSTTTFDPLHSSSTHKLQSYVNPDAMPVGTDSTKRWIAEFEVRDEPLFKEFELVYNGTFWNSFQGETDEWAETSAQFPIKRLILSVVFPESKPFTENSLEFRHYPFGQNTPRDQYPSPTYVISEDKSTVTWTIPEPTMGYIYRMEWKW